MRWQRTLPRQLRAPKPACAAGLGSLAALSDELLLNVFSLLAAPDLCRTKAASKALFCFCSHDDLWRSLTLQARAVAPLCAWRPLHLA